MDSNIKTLPLIALVQHFYNFDGGSHDFENLNTIFLLIHDFYCCC